jgi:serine/threonine protein kinase
MPVSTDEFWKLTVASGLLSPEGCQALRNEFASLKGATGQANAASLAQWLLAGGKLTRYQASVLLSGRPGPFVFGDFVIVERIEAGRLSRLFRAIYKGTQPALLMFAAGGDDSTEETRATIARFEIARAAKSPHLSRVYQFHAAATPPFFVLEDLQGASLPDFLAGRQPALAEACRIGFHATLGLVALQEMRGVHGGLCPANLWVEPTGSVKLLQFPLVGPLVSEARRDPRLVDYLAPELADPRNAPDALSDIYALGCTLYELIAGRPLFPGGTPEQKIKRHAVEIPQRIDQLVPGVSEDLADLLAEMLAKEPMLRAQTASHVAHLLAPFASGASEARKARPPSEAPRTLTPGYGAWHEPGWQAPPKQAPSHHASQQAAIPVANPVELMARAARPLGDTTPQRSAAESKTDAADDADAPFIVVGSNAGDPSVMAPAGAALVSRHASNTTLIGVGAGLILIALVALVGYLVADRGPATTIELPATKSASGTNNVAGASVPPSGGANPENSAAETNAPVAGSETPRDGAASSPNATHEVDDDGQSLWARPTAGQPLDARYLPAGTQLFLALRPAEILASEEGRKLVDALGPAGHDARTLLESVLGVDLAKVEQVTIAFAPDETGAPQPAYVMRLAEPLPEATLLAGWGQPQPATLNKNSYFQSNRRAYFLPGDDAGRVIVISAPMAMKEILERNGDPPLRREIEQLLRTSDDRQHFILLGAPGYLLTDGQSLLAGDLAKLHDALPHLFGMNVQALSASAHLGDELFLELRVAAPADQQPQQLASDLSARLARLSEHLEQYVASLTPNPYGRLIVNRFPLMVQMANSFTRFAAEDRQAVLRCYLPASAAHNLVLGAQLTLFEETASAASGAAASAAAAGTSTPNQPATPLDKIVSLSFPRDTLEHSLELLSQEIETPIVIQGTDLQLEGITKNQSFALDERGKPAREILAKVLALANPDGKLIWVARPDEAGRETIVITTRAAAAKRGDPLPPDPAPKNPRN